MLISKNYIALCFLVVSSLFSCTEKEQENENSFTTNQKSVKTDSSVNENDSIAKLKVGNGKVMDSTQNVESSVSSNPEVTSSDVDTNYYENEGAETSLFNKVLKYAMYPVSALLGFLLGFVLKGRLYKKNNTSKMKGDNEIGNQMILNTSETDVWRQEVNRLKSELERTQKELQFRADKIKELEKQIEELKSKKLKNEENSIIGNSPSVTEESPVQKSMYSKYASEEGIFYESHLMTTNDDCFYKLEISDNSASFEPILKDNNIVMFKNNLQMLLFPYCTAENYDGTNNFTGINIISAGKAVKNGDKWIVSEENKVKIRFY